MSIQTRRIGTGRETSELLNYIRALERRIAALEDGTSGADRDIVPVASEPKAGKATPKRRKGSAANAEV